MQGSHPLPPRTRFNLSVGSPELVLPVSNVLGWTGLRGMGDPMAEGPGQDQARHDCPDPRLLGYAEELGALEEVLRGEGLYGPHTCVPGVRGRGRGAPR
jgi:hypothetical protein